MRKLYVLLTLLLFTGTAWAQTAITSLSQLSNSKVYYLKSGRTITENTPHYLVYNTQYSNGYLSSTYGSSGHATTFDQNQIDNQFLFAIYKVGEQYFMYNLAARKFVGNATGDNAAIPMADLPQSSITFKERNHNNYPDYPWMLSTNNFTGAINVAATSGRHGIVNWEGGRNNTGDAGNAFQICEAGNLSAETQTTIRSAFITLISDEINYASDVRVGAITTSDASSLTPLKTAYESNPSDETLSALYTAYAACNRITLAAGDIFKVKCKDNGRGYLAYSANTQGAGDAVPTLASVSGFSGFLALNAEGVSTDWVMVEVSGKKYIYNAQIRKYLATGNLVVFSNEGTYVTFNQLVGPIHGIYFNGSSGTKLSFSPGYGAAACIRTWNGSDDGTKFYIEKTGEIDDYASVMVEKFTLRSLLTKVNTYTIGTNVGQYNNSAQTAKAVRDNAQDVLNNTNATLAEVQAAITALEGITLNLPKVGKLYRFQGKVSNKYMCPSNATGQMAMEAKREGADTHEKRASIFMLLEGEDVDGDGTNDYKFLNYEHGYYIQGTREMGATNANANSIKIAVNDTKEYYTMKSNATGSIGTWLYDNGSQSTPVVDRNGTYKANNCDWIITEATYLPVKISSTYRYGTFTSPVNLIQDTDRLKFYTGVMRNGYLELTQYNGIIPAGTPFFIEYVAGSTQSEGSSFLPITTEKTTFSGTNDLEGQIETINTPTGLGTIYTLQPAWDDDTDDHNSTSQVAFRRFSGTTIRGCTAYLPIPNNAPQVAGMRFVSDEATVIEGITDDQQHEVEAYDLSGRRVQQAKKGLYIINGKKVIIR